MYNSRAFALASPPVKVEPRIAYAVVISLLALTLLQCLEIEREVSARHAAQQQLRWALDKVAKLEQSNALISLRLVALDAKDPAYVNARVFVAWDASQHRGSILLQDFPLTPAGQDYQLWVLDPNAPAPLSAGIITGSRVFEVAACSMPRPGFAITLEPKGGSATPTIPILFAVAPAE
ncbi:MAG TPA: anti-sigma factor [Candidatus Methylacidiphilales bacterium]|jgi:anti-sigma-K factor RskA|nr:anti-sigma factor [Candidatus Methylacidiphilales bacterium]